MKKISISIADDVEAELGKRMGSLGKTNRSEYIESLIRFALKAQEVPEDDKQHRPEQ